MTAQLPWYWTDKLMANSPFLLERKEKERKRERKKERKKEREREREIERERE